MLCCIKHSVQALTSKRQTKNKFLQIEIQGDKNAIPNGQVLAWESNPDLAPNIKPLSGHFARRILTVILAKTV